MYMRKEVPKIIMPILHMWSLIVESLLKVNFLPGQVRLD